MRSVAAALVASLALAACGGRTTVPAASTAVSQPPADPTTLRYVAGSARYRLETVNQTAQEVMGSSQEFQLTQTFLLSTALAEAAGELTVAITVDSVTVLGTVPGLDANALEAARGQLFRARFTPLGHGLGVVVPDSTSPVMLQVGRGLRDFLPRMPAAPITAGLTWTDTVSDAQTMPGGGGRMTTRSIRQNRIIGWEDRDGTRALHIAISGAFEIAGTGEAQGQPVEITGSGQATADRWVSATGQYLGGTTRDSTNLTVNVTRAGITVPVRQVQTTIVTRLP
jgi:hypothetical protein